LNYVVPIALLVVLAAIALWSLAAARRRAHKDLTDRTLIEDALKHVHDANHRGMPLALESLAARLGRRTSVVLRLVERMHADGLVETGPSGLRLTAAGNDWALQVVRAHRLWERYLSDQAGWPLADLHAEADRREHSRAPGELDALDAGLGHPRHDPHGDPIPTASGDLERERSVPLTRWPVGLTGEIAHIEDEPTAAYEQILAMGLRPGVQIRVIESTPSRLLAEANMTQHSLAPIVAAGVTVRPVRRTPVPAGLPLTALRVGDRATVVALDGACQGLTRRRLLDLGLTPGVTIEAALPNPFGDPLAYRVRGTLIALRGEQAQHVIVNPATITRGAH
jgi:DtxR family Mn-dependent transcriptional regulator